MYKIHTKYKYDKTDKVIKESLVASTDDIAGLDIINGIQNTTTLDTTYKYDGNGNVIKVTSPDGTTVERKFDSLNRKTEETTTTNDVDGNPKSATEYFTYFGNSEKLVTHINSVGKKVVNRYTNDTKHRKEEYEDGSSVTYEYDFSGKVISSTVTDKFSKNPKKTTYIYDSRDREILSYVDIYNEDNTTRQLVLKAYMYDSTGNIIKEVDGEAYKNAQGNTREEKIKNALGNQNTYNARGNLISTITAENIVQKREHTHKYEYDVFGNMTKDIDTKNNAYAYKYDSNYN